MTEDPVEGLNLYTYAGNNPVLYVDPDGRNRLIQDALLEARKGGINSAIYWENRSGLGSIFKGIYQDENNNQFKYLFGLATMTSDVGENSLGNSWWAINELVRSEMYWELTLGLGFILNRPGTGKTEKHHIATDKSKKFDFRNHPAFKETGINVSKDIDNLVDLANHRGRHTNKYHQEVQDRLDAVYNRYGGTDKLEGAVRSELQKMKQELLDGKLNPYGK